MRTKIFLVLIMTITLKASSLCLDGVWMDKIDLNKLTIHMTGNEPMWNASILKGSTFVFNNTKKTKIRLSFNQTNSVIFFETEDKSIFGRIILKEKCVPNEEGNYKTELVIDNRLYIDGLTTVSYTLPKTSSKD